MTQLDPSGIAPRVWRKDASLWGPGDDDPAERLGWLSLPEAMRSEIDDLVSFAQTAVDEGIDTVALLGMGGSSLAPEVFFDMYGPMAGMPSLVVLDSTHPKHIRAQRADLDLDRTLFIVSSKSGGTVETMSLYRYFRSLVADGDRFVAITDPGTSLEELARAESFRRVFPAPTDVGGRYSALSFFGLVPAALCGVDLDGLLRAAASMAEACSPDRGPGSNPGLDLGLALSEHALQKRDKLTFLIDEDIASFGDWVEQLIAESTGKRNTGIVPIVHEPSASADRYGSDRTFVRMGSLDRETHATLPNGLDGAGHPVIVVPADAQSLGGQIFAWEFATAVAGAVLGINPFDQPDVEAAKVAARRALEGPGAIEWPAEDPAPLFDGMVPPEYAALLAFAPASSEHRAVLDAARRKLLARFGVATMAGFGPRYLHSTGQLHKGGPPGVRALVVLDPPDSDEPIPGSEHGFARLIAAQAQGDADALEKAGRRVARTTWERFAAWAMDSPG